MIAASCHCGAVQIAIDAPPPTELNDCTCSICRRLGALWAYYEAPQVRITGETASYVWNHKVLAFHSCKICKCTTHWMAIDARYLRMGVNARMMEPAIFRAARVMQTSGPG